MYQRILVPVDGSETSKRGLQEALRLAQTLDASVRILHVVDESGAIMNTDVAGANVADLMERMAANGGEILHDAVEIAGREGVAAESALKENITGGIAECVLREAESWGAELIVMGTHGRSGLVHAFLGSEAEKVVHETRVPVLLVRVEEGGES